MIQNTPPSANKTSNKANLLMLAASLTASLAGCGIEPGSGTHDSVSSQATTGTRSPFYLSRTGEVRTPYGSFPSLGDWYRSPEFHRHGAKCGAQLPERRASQGTKLGPDVDTLAAPGDCTMSFTDLDTEYALKDINLVIPVVFHNIMRADATGHVSDEQFLSQIDVLNEDFGVLEGSPGDGILSNDVHVRFVLAGITRVQNDAWFDLPIAHEADYKTALHWDVNRYLNIYVTGIPEDGTLAWAAFPQEDAGEVTADGIVMSFDLVGKDALSPPYDQGRTVTHEVGHYLGLLHTFEPNDPSSTGVCENGWDAGDLIHGTPMQDAPTFGCPAQFQACGVDVPSLMGNAHNYMDYSDDTCMFYFTIEQANRAVCGLVNYRSNLYREIPAIYDVNNVVGPKVPGGGEIYLLKSRVPAGSEMVLQAMPDLPAGANLPPANVRLRLSRMLPNTNTWELVAETLSSGMTPAKIVHPVAQNAFYKWSVTHEDGGSPPPHAASITYLNCYDADSPDHIKDIPECNP